jgi:spermidine synthase
MRHRRLFLAAYAFSGLAALIYQVTWTRLVTLQMGHTMAAASAVVAAFMGGLAAGAVLGGRMASAMMLRRALYAYAVLECLVAVTALILPFELGALRPVLSWSYRNGAPGAVFPLIRMVSCLVLILIPATALGATFPVAVRCFVRESDRVGRAAGELYVTNTTGAAMGALAAGFMLIPRIGIFGTTLVGVAANGLAIAVVLALARQASGAEPVSASRPPDARSRRSARDVTDKSRQPPLSGNSWWLPAVALGLSGFAALVHEMTWIRVLSLIMGPTTYAFAATLAAVIGGIAFGSVFGSWLAGRTPSPAFWLVVALTATAIAVSVTSWLGGGYLPRFVVHQLAQSPSGVGQLFAAHAMLGTALVVPTAVGMGLAFPLALELVKGSEQSTARRLGIVYAVNTLGAVAGSLVASLLLIPLLGLQRTLLVVSGLLVLDAFVVAAWAPLTRRARIACLLPTLAAVGMLVLSPPWNRDLLASGVYKYARDAESDFLLAGGSSKDARAAETDLDLETVLAAGHLLYYRDGAASTVSVKRRTGVVSLAVDGKVDASNSGDMVTQKTLAHLPLLLHPHPRDVAIIGLGSGVTLGSALLHPIARADVIEISPEVVEASRYFSTENRNPLNDPRTHLIVGDGRSHMLLSSRKYDVVISEPSNPWMTGVAALFTREFFLAARDRLAPGGIICQWAHTYDISDSDLRSIVATFASVFPNGTLWLIGQGDLLLVASTGSLDLQVADIARGWQNPTIAADLVAVSALEPFEFWSMFTGGPQEMKRYAAGAMIQTDDRMALEFSGPRAINAPGAGAENARQLHQLLNGGPPVIRHALETATAVQWRNRGAMMRKIGDYAVAYDDDARALSLDPTDAPALDGLVQAAVATHQEAAALGLLKSFSQTHPRAPAIWIAMSRLLAAHGSLEEAVGAATQALTIQPGGAEALTQLASIFADAGDASRLAPLVDQLLALQPPRASSQYYAAAYAFLKGQFAEARRSAQQAISLDRRYVAAYNLLGATYGSLGEQNEARKAFQTALELNPSDSSIYLNLGVLELTSGNPTAAAGYLAESLSLDPASVAARDGLARARTAISE